MRQLLFNLQHVPEDEAEQVRELLSDHEILFYETQAGRWRLGLAAIWLPDTRQLAEAKNLLEDYQKQRFESAQEERQVLEAQGIVEAFLVNFYARPIKVLAALAGVIVVLLVSILPFT